MKFKYSKRLTCIFFTFLIATTFFSRSLTYWLSAKVKISNPSNGIIKETKLINEFEAIYQNEEILYFNNNIVDKFYVESFINEGQIVMKNQVLFQLHITDYIEIKKEYKKRLKKLEIENLYIQKEKKLNNEKYINEFQKINEKLQQVELEIKAIEEGNILELIEADINIDNKKQEKARISNNVVINEELLSIGAISLNEHDLEVDKLRVIENELKLLEKSYFDIQNKHKEESVNIKESLNKQLYELEYNNKMYTMSKDKELQNLVNEREEIEDEVEGLTILGKDIQIKSPIDGIVSNVTTFDENYYIAGELLCKIKPVSDPPLYKITIPIRDIEDWSEKNEILINIGDKNISCEIVDIIYSTDENRDVVIQPMEMLEKEDYLKEAVIRFNKLSEFYSIIIPSSALIDGQYVYTLNEEDYGIWGIRYFIVKSPVTIGDYNSKEIGIKSGLTIDSKVIIDWDRELEEGQRVMIEIP